MSVSPVAGPRSRVERLEALLSGWGARAPRLVLLSSADGDVPARLNHTARVPVWRAPVDVAAGQIVQVTVELSFGTLPSA